MSISVIIPAHNAALWLAEAIASVAAQDVPAEVIVVDDGSTDDTAAVARRHGAQVLRHDAPGGPSAARNTGARAATGEALLFLDADDRLLPGALAHAAACRAAHPQAGFVYGAHRRVDTDWQPLTPPVLERCEPDARLAFLRTNCVGMIATALFDRAKLLELGGFDQTLRQCEDYDLFLRLAMRWPVACHDHLMAEYRIHGTNASGYPAEVLAAARAVQARHRPSDPAGQAAMARGRRDWTRAYALSAWRDNAGLPLPRIAGQRWRMARLAPAATLLAAAIWAARRTLPPATFAKAKRRLTGTPEPGRANLGDMDRPTPISPNFGYDRGTPIDRFYIERFLHRRRADIRGRVLEVGDAEYSQRYGGAAITRQDVLHAHADNPDATIVGDLGQPGLLPADTFDCMVLTQTLMLVWDMPAAAAELYAALKPGGVLLLTVPGTSSVDRGEWGANWFWSLTGSSVTRMFEPLFGAENIAVTVECNVYAATCFLHGLAQEEVRTEWLEQADAAYPMVVTLRAVKAG